MIKRLRRQLTWLYTITTGTILILVIFGALLFLIHREEQKQLEQFQSNWMTVRSRVQFDNIIAQSWLAQMEADNRMVIHIEENNTPLLFAGSWTPATKRSILVERGKELAREQGISMESPPVSSYISQTSLMVVDGDDDDQYYAMVLSIATDKGVKGLCLLSYIIPGITLIKGTLWFLGILAAAGIIALFFVSWYFVGWSLKPVEESRQKQAEFIASASHELRSPLAVLRSDIGAIRAVPEKSELLLTQMDKECVRMGRLVSDLLLLASTDAKTWTIHPEKTELDTLLIDTYEMFLPLCREKMVELQLQLPEAALFPIKADEERLTQVITILLDNALCYTPSGASITILVKQHLLSKPYRPSQTGVCRTIIEIRDQGCGIPDSMKPHVFDRFYRGDLSRTDKQHFGLGLSIAYELIRLHHGTITLTDHEGGGSIFRVTLNS